MIYQSNFKIEINNLKSFIDDWNNLGVYNLLSKFRNYIKLKDLQNIVRIIENFILLYMKK